MQMTVYQLLMYHNPQALADLDHYQRHWYDCCINAPVHGGPDWPLVILDVQVEPLENIKQLMRQAPSKSRGGQDE